ncbi:MAG: maleate cis-trans isomerase family protein [Gammaproteobacteria bacterium]
MNQWRQRPYGTSGRVGIGTPQANPTVEAEFAILLPRTCTMHVTRMTSAAADPMRRLVEYLERLGDCLAAFDALRPDVFGFACTGSSYLLGREAEDRIITQSAARLGYPVETAARAILWGLGRVAARRIALVVPYPEPVVEAALRYWAAAGIEVALVERVAIGGADTRGIYALGHDAAVRALARVPLAGLDAVLVSGTGMPSLAALRGAAAGTPVISSNSCLAARLLDLLGRDDLLAPGSPEIRGWQQRFDEAQAN